MASWGSLGYAHVAADVREVGGSRESVGEADALARWLAGRRQELEAWYGGAALEDVVAVLTPYRPQVAVLRTALRRVGIGAGMTVGTVNTLQGAERGVVICSLVRKAREGAGRFLDEGNVFNVMVSRARNAFVAVGNMGALDPRGGDRPSAVLARAMFEGEGREIVDPVFVRASFGAGDRDGVGRGLGNGGDGGGVGRIDTLEGHRTALRQALETARQRVLVVSPWLSILAVRADGVEAMIRGAIGRGVEVVVACDRGFTERESAAESAKAALALAGASVRVVDGLHAKMLAVDDEVIVVGSFNWLSAIRDEKHPWSRYEMSLRFAGVGVGDMIADAWREVRPDLGCVPMAAD